MRLAPNFAVAYSNLGATLKPPGASSESIVCFEEALRFDANLAEAHNGLGSALESSDNADEALAEFSGRWPAARLCRGPRQPGATARPAGAPCRGARTAQSRRQRQAGAGLGAAQPRAGAVAHRAILPPAGPSTNGAGGWPMRCLAPQGNRGTASRSRGARSCSIPSKGWATRCNSSAMRRWSKQRGGTRGGRLSAEADSDPEHLPGRSTGCMARTSRPCRSTCMRR